MELSEVVSANVAIPVLGVVIFALFVFTYGFKSPPQPPSFDFEDERKQNQKRGKKGKQLKGQTNGHVVAEVQEETSSKPPTPKATKASPKAKSSDGKSPKAETATPRTEGKKDKSKKVAGEVQDEAKTKGGNSAPTGKGKRTEDEDGQWETKRSRKDKKQKPKKDEKTEALGKVDSEERRKSDEMELDNGSAPADQKTKKKKKVSKAKPIEEPKIEPVRAVFTGEAAAAPQVIKIDVEKPLSTSRVQDRVTEEFEVSQSKKNKRKEKKTTPVAPAVAVTPKATNKDAAQATTKDSKDAISIRKTKVDQAKEALPPAEVKPAISPKKKKGKSNSGDAGVAAQQAKEEHVVNVKPAEDIKAEEPIKVKATKSEKNKVSASKPAAAAKSQASATVETKPAAAAKSQASAAVETKPAAAAKSQASATVETKPAAALESRAPPPETAAKEPSAIKPVAPVSFDELGGSSDSWTEAPKSKKKRPRKDN